MLNHSHHKLFCTYCINFLYFLIFSIQLTVINYFDIFIHNFILHFVCLMTTCIEDRILKKKEINEISLNDTEPHLNTWTQMICYTSNTCLMPSLSTEFSLFNNLK